MTFGLVARYFIVYNFKFNFFNLNLIDNFMIQVYKSRISNYIQFEYFNQRYEKKYIASSFVGFESSTHVHVVFENNTFERF